MARCLELAMNGLGNTATNPLVGCVIVHDGRIIGEGYHHVFGGPHAEVNAINSVSDKSLLKTATLYVNLEPCSHWGKTPPCADLIIENKIPNVVIGTKDIYEEVNGKGIEKLKNAGIHVEIGVLEKESIDRNKRFFTFNIKINNGFVFFVYINACNFWFVVNINYFMYFQKLFCCVEIFSFNFFNCFFYD